MIHALYTFIFLLKLTQLRQLRILVIFQMGILNVRPGKLSKVTKLVSWLLGLR